MPTNIAGILIWYFFLGLPGLPFFFESGFIDVISIVERYPSCDDKQLIMLLFNFGIVGGNLSKKKKKRQIKERMKCQ